MCFACLAWPDLDGYRQEMSMKRKKSFRGRRKKCSYCIFNNIFKSVFEFAAGGWNSALTCEIMAQIEIEQKGAVGVKIPVL